MILSILCFLAGTWFGYQQNYEWMMIFYVLCIWTIPVGRTKPSTAVKALLTILLVVVVTQHRLTARLADHKTLTVQFIDVGQGDCTLITLPEGERILIDGGTEEAAANVLQILKENQADRIDLLIATHPHADHIGSLPAIIDAYPVKEYAEPDLENTKMDSSYRSQLLHAKLNQYHIPEVRVSAGDELLQNDTYSLQVLSPSKDSHYDDLNDASLILKLSYGKTAFMFMADAGFAAENNILNEDLSCDVLRVGHHGSYGSTGSAFLNEADPDYAVISVGKDNEHHLPHESVLKRLEDIGVTILRTDEDGTITIQSDGTAVQVIRSS